MIDYVHPVRPDERLSTAEREEAVAHLGRAQQEGRLSSAELAERSAKARSATTRADLVPLFSDLPSVHSAPASADPPWSAAGYSHYARPDYRGARRRPLGGAVGATIMALVPFVALGLFFLTGNLYGYVWSWLWFLLIPIAGIVIYGPGADERNR